MSLSTKIFSITTLSIMTFRIKITCDTQHNDRNEHDIKKGDTMIISIAMGVMLSVVYVKCVFALLNYAIAEHSYAKFHLC